MTMEPVQEQAQISTRAQKQESPMKNVSAMGKKFDNSKLLLNPEKHAVNAGSGANPRRMSMLD